MSRFPQVYRSAGVRHDADAELDAARDGCGRRADEAGPALEQSHGRTGHRFHYVGARTPKVNSKAYIRANLLRIAHNRGDGNQKGTVEYCLHNLGCAKYGIHYGFY